MENQNKSLIQAQLRRLETIAQRSQEALELSASFGDYQTALTKFKNRKDIFERAIKGLQQVVPIDFYAFYSTGELQFDIEIEHCDKKEKEPYIVENVDYLIEKGVVALAFQKKRTFTTSTKDRKHTILVHSMATTSKFYGIFFCFLEKKPFEPSIVDKITTIVMKSTCYALENFELYQLVDRKNAELTDNNSRLSKEIQEKVKIQSQLEKSEIIYRNTFENTGNPTIIIDSNGLITHSNSQFLAFSELKKDSLINRKNIFDFIISPKPMSLPRLLHETEKQGGHNAVSEYIFENHSREKKTVFLNISPLGLENRYIVSLTDVTELKRVEKQLQHQAFHDPLTNLPNRMLLEDRLNQAVKKLNRNKDYKYAVIFIDLDRFKNINDTLGHNVGDLLLVQTAQKIKKCVREVDTVARFGGDEFVILLEDVKNHGVCDVVSGRIMKEFRKPVHIEGHEIFVTISMGILFCGDKEMEHTEAVRLADISMLQAKKKGRNTVVYFHEIADKDIEKKLLLENHLQTAIQKNEIFLQYQPLIDLQKNQLYGLEALVRWNHPELGLQFPGAFIPIAEETGLIIPLGQKIFELAFHDFSKWLLQFPQAHSLFLTINLSAKQMFQKDLVESVRKAASHVNMPLKNVNLEITESVFIEDQDLATKTINDLKKLGVSISIDDFGAGYCSLKYLNHYAIDLVKIDRSLISNITTNETNFKIVASMLELCRELNLDVLAEGIEELEQLDKLKKMKCRLGQGYYFFPPQDKKVMEQIIFKAMKNGGALREQNP